MNKRKVVILGLGMQGKAALHDIVYNSDASPIIVIDNSSEPGSYITRFPSQRVYFRRINAADESGLASIIQDAGVVIEALPGEFSFPVGRLAAKLGVNLVSSMYYINPGEQDTEKIKHLREELRRIHREATDKVSSYSLNSDWTRGLILSWGHKPSGRWIKLTRFIHTAPVYPFLKLPIIPLSTSSVGLLLV
ncbi:MAG: hypothetical protein GTO45_05190 [Candidatus Aminicenantes bacterium]|nr:hypothetical protein [Candidatus Aminicenantes bacterium]NIM78146.1 hypothetical protein [Candidatus Aminicenantes bacterium]NIN17470.1 hypothetical protein [Candidatus Aminicenantes bacterium]NIN41366.1 hypothetical protein [Candidatus Aminicenantes bacterium]NIN84132.1 hypothetical protein [Candidatus Aminicenantes bacterium]